MSVNPLVSVVILSYNRKPDLVEGLQRLRNQSYKNTEIIVVDNRSDDGTPELLRERFPDVRLFVMPQNIGIEAYNTGFKNARGKYIVILDDDSFPGKFTVEKMVEKFEADRRLGIAAFNIKHYSAYNPADDNIKPLDEPADTQQYLMSFNGCGVGLRRKPFKAAGFYPGEFFLYFNEMDTTLRILNKGYTCKSFPDLPGYHKASPTNRASSRAPFYYSRNAFWIVWKHYPLDMAVAATYKLLCLCFYHSITQRTAIYLKALFNAVTAFDITKRKPVKRSIAKNLRLPFETAFTFYR